MRNGLKPYAAVPAAARRWTESVKPVQSTGSSSAPGSSSARQAATASGSVPRGSDALGQAESRDRLVEGSEHFTCNGPNAEITLPAVIDETWAELPREQPIYGPVEGSRTDCVAAVSGDGERTFADYTAAFRELDGWQVEQDRPRRFTMSRDDVRVTVALTGDGITTIRVGVS